MSDESIEMSDTASNGFSRRNALKAGVAVGVGATAWSGATITSLGGTPAYAAGCTFAVQFDLVTCRNTDQGAAQCPKKFRYHVLGDQLANGFSIVNNILEGTCCSPGNGVNGTSHPVLKWTTSGLTCQVRLLINLPDNCNGASVADVLLGSSQNGTTGIDIDLACPGETVNGTTLPADVPSQSQYRITVSCVTTGQECCFTPQGC
jgi:hypothetical protein